MLASLVLSIFPGDWSRLLQENCAEEDSGFELVLFSFYQIIIFYTSSWFYKLSVVFVAIFSFIAFLFCACSNHYCFSLGIHGPRIAQLRLLFLSITFFFFSTL